MAKVDIGDAAPDFELEGTDGLTFRLSEHRGHNVVLAFYPGDATTVCVGGERFAIQATWSTGNRSGTAQPVLRGR